MGLEIENIRYAHGAGHTDICLGLKDSHILTCGSDGYVRIWDGPDDDDSSSDFVADQALSVAYSNEHYFVATNNNYVQGYTYSDRKRDKILFRFSAPVTHVITSCNNKYIAAGSCDMEIQILHTETNKITTLMGHTAPILGLSFDPLEEFLASSSCDGTIKIWELSSGSVVKTFTNVIPLKNDFFKAVVLGRCAWKSLSGLLFAIPQGLEVIVYRRNIWEQLFKLSSQNLEKDLSAVLFSPCGNYVAAASICGEIIIWEIKYKTEVCYYKDSKKVGISGILWQPDGSKILFCDRLGRMGVLTGISEEISKHSVPPEKKDVAKKDTRQHDDAMSRNSFYLDDEFDDADAADDDEEDGCISIEKIKSLYCSAAENNDFDEKYVGSPASLASDNAEKNIVLLPKLQLPFQPASTPQNFEPRCLCFNNIGMIRYYDADKTIDIQFHDASFHHSLFLRSFGVCTMASLSSKVICLAVPSLDDNLSKLTCINLSSWAGKKEWTINLPLGEDILAVATSGDWVAIATNLNNLRIFSHAGTQKQIIALPGRILCMSGHDQKLLAVCLMGVDSYENQNFKFILYEVFNYYLHALKPFQCLPISPKSNLKWLGFTDEGTACTYDDEGVLRFLGHDLMHWLVICDTKIEKKSKSDNYFIVGISELHQNIRCIYCKNSQYPLLINNPTVVEISLKMPVCEADDAKSTAEEKFLRLMFSIFNMKKINMNGNEIYNNFELPLIQTILKLFGDACNNSEDLRAVDLATFMTKKPLDIAIKYANIQGKSYLVEKLKNIKPVQWMLDEFAPTGLPKNIFTKKNLESKNLIETNCDSSFSQKDLFEDSAVTSVTESQSHGANPESEPEIKGPMNPFKKVNIPNDENPKGLKYFDRMEKDSSRTSDSFNISKPLKLKLPSNKEKNSESKSKKPSFVEWFSKKKASLSEEYPNVSSSELTKMGMKLYREEMSESTVDRSKALEVVSSNSDSAMEDSKKRDLFSVNESDPKRFKSQEL